MLVGRVRGLLEQDAYHAHFTIKSPNLYSYCKQSFVYLLIYLNYLLGVQVRPLAKKISSFLLSLDNNFNK